MAKAKTHFPLVSLAKVQSLVKPSKATRSVRLSVQKSAPASKRRQPYSIPIEP